MEEPIKANFLATTRGERIPQRKANKREQIKAWVRKGNSKKSVNKLMAFPPLYYASEMDREHHSGGGHDLGYRPYFHG